MKKTGNSWIFLLLLLLNWISYEYGRSVAGFDMIEASAQVEELQHQIEQMDRKNDEIQQHNAMLERNSRIDGDAGKHLEYGVIGSYGTDSFGRNIGGT